ncbi:MAG TPA: hypothetical protein VNR40_22475 [Steroidobacter sp.]|nr:hypothetical protein [Steroidobacter sp.]
MDNPEFAVFPTDTALLDTIVSSSNAPTIQAARVALRDARCALDTVDSFLHVSIFALRGQGCDVDHDVAVVLDEAWGKVSDARDRIVIALEQLPEVAP